MLLPFLFNPLCGLPKPLRSSLLLAVYCNNGIVGEAFSPASSLLSCDVCGIFGPHLKHNLSGLTLLPHAGRRENGGNFLLTEAIYGRAQVSRYKIFFSIHENFLDLGKILELYTIFNFR